MPALKNPRHEAFAQGRATGKGLDDAYEEAGFAPAKGHASRMANRSDVAERVAELRAEQSEAEKASLPMVIAALLDMARVGAASESPAMVKEARLALLDAARLQNQLGSARAIERVEIFNSSLNF